MAVVELAVVVTWQSAAMPRLQLNGPFDWLVGWREGGGECDFIHEQCLLERIQGKMKARCVCCMMAVQESVLNRKTDLSIGDLM